MVDVLDLVGHGYRINIMNDLKKLVLIFVAETYALLDTDVSLRVHRVALTRAVSESKYTTTICDASTVESTLAIQNTT